MKRTILAAALIAFALGCKGENQPKGDPSQPTEEQIKAQKGRDAIINSGGKMK